MLARSQLSRCSCRRPNQGRFTINTIQSSRQLSSASLRTSRIFQRPSHPQPSSRILQLQQTRSLSLWGYGSSSKPPPPPPVESEFPIPASISFPDQASAVKATYPVSNAASTSQSSITDVPFTDPSSSSPTIAETTAEFASIPERIGYLKEVCGIDFGWGTSTIWESVYEYLHIYSGLGWGASAVAMAVLFKIITFRTHINAQKASQKMRDLKPVLAPLQARYKEQVAAGDRNGYTVTAAELRAINKDAGIKMLDGFKPIIYSIPFTFGGFRTLRGATGLPVPAFETESLLWLNNLVVSDHIYLPILCGSMTFLAIQLNKRSAVTPNARLMVIFQWVLPVISLVFTYIQPGAVQIWFTLQAGLNLGQTILFNTGSSRKLLGMTPLPSTDKLAAESLIAEQEFTRMVGGMNMTPASYVNVKGRDVTTTSTSTPTPAAAPKQDVSMIDKLVDGVKAPLKNMVQGSEEDVAKKLAKRKKDAEAKRQEDYEYKRRQAEDLEREGRNERASRRKDKKTL